MLIHLYIVSVSLLTTRAELCTWDKGIKYLLSGPLEKKFLDL